MDSEDRKYLYQFQFIVIGEKGVGKSSLLQNFANGDFQECMQSTVGIDFHKKYVIIDKHNFKLQLWDTAGQERFKAVIRPYFRNAVGAILVFDITDSSTFTALHGLIEEVRDYHKQGLPLFMLVGNKSDDSAKREVRASDALEFASSNNIVNYLETSAKTGANIDQVFHQLTKKVYENIQNGSIVIDEQWRGVREGNEFTQDPSHPPTLYRRISDVSSTIDKRQQSNCCH